MDASQPHASDNSTRRNLVAIFVLTVTLGQVISHTATVLIVVPIALAVISSVWPFAP